MTIYIVGKLAKEITGESVAYSIEAAFTKKESAQAYLNQKPAVFEEVIGGAEFQCERGVFEVELQ